MTREATAAAVAAEGVPQEVQPVAVVVVGPLAAPPAVHLAEPEDTSVAVVVAVPAAETQAGPAVAVVLVAAGRAAEDHSTVDTAQVEHTAHPASPASLEVAAGLLASMATPVSLLVLAVPATAVLAVVEVAARLERGSTALEASQEPWPAEEASSQEAVRQAEVQVTEFCWNVVDGWVLFHNTSEAANDRFRKLFRTTFGLVLAPFSPLDFLSDLPELAEALEVQGISDYRSAGAYSSEMP